MGRAADGTETPLTPCSTAKIWGMKQIENVFSLPIGREVSLPIARGLRLDDLKGPF